MTSLRIQLLRSALEEARRQAQRDRHQVVCVIADDDTAAIVPGDPDSRAVAAGGVRAIVRPDEPILFCGLFPA